MDSKNGSNVSREASQNVGAKENQGLSTEVLQNLNRFLITQTQLMQQLMQQLNGNNVSEIACKIRLIAFLDCARYLIAQGEAFRGHDESSTSINKVMICADIQKELSKACAQKATKVIKGEIGDRNFAVLIDESRDVSIKEQMAVIVRFVNNQGKVMERFALVGLLDHHGLPISRLRGQDYDGASNMRGEFNGLQNLIRDENPNAFYVHCFPHQLQLVVVIVASCSRAIADFFNYVPLIVIAVSASCKRKDALIEKHHDILLDKLEDGLISTGRGMHQKSDLARPGDTRWGTHLKTLLRIYQMWEAIVDVLELISEDACQNTSHGGVAGLMKNMKSFQFVFIMHFLITLLSITNKLSLALQRKHQDIVETMGLIQDVKEHLQDIRDNECEPLFD